MRFNRPSSASLSSLLLATTSNASRYLPYTLTAMSALRQSFSLLSRAAARPSTSSAVPALSLRRSFPRYYSEPTASEAAEAASSANPEQQVATGSASTSAKEGSSNAVEDAHKAALEDKQKQIAKFKVSTVCTKSYRVLHVTKARKGFSCSCFSRRTIGSEVKRTWRIW